MVIYNNYGIGASAYPTHPKSTATITSTAIVPNLTTASTPTVVPTNPTALNGPICYSNNNGLTTRTAPGRCYDTQQSPNFNVPTTLKMSNYFRRS